MYFGSRQFDDENVFLLEHFRNHSMSLGFEHRIQKIALTERLWKHRDSPIVFSRGSKAIANFFDKLPESQGVGFCQR